MFRVLALLWLVTTLPVLAHANTSLHIESSNCSGNMTVSSFNGASLSCSGNLAFDGGLISSDTSISIFATGDLWLNNLNLNAPEIVLSVLSGQLSVGSNVNMVAINNTTNTNSGGRITLNGPTISPVIKWNTFEIGLTPGGNINFGGGSNPSIINRVMGGNISLISGASHVYLLNTNGIVLTNTSAGVISISGAVMSADASLFAVNSTVANAFAVPEVNSCALLLLGLTLIAFKRKEVA